MSTSGWTFLTNHTHVLVCITRDPGATMRAIAAEVGITERAVQRIVGELVESGYLSRTRDGRRNEYAVNSAEPLRHPLENATRLKDLLALLTATAESRHGGRPGHNSPGEAGAALTATASAAQDPEPEPVHRSS